MRVAWAAAFPFSLTGFPSALNSPYGSPPIDIFVNAGSIASNTFSVSGGNISTATFSASLSIGGGAFFITTDTTSANQLFFALPTPPQPPNITLCQNSAAATCVTFTPGGTGSVPEPDTWAWSQWIGMGRTSASSEPRLMDPPAHPNSTDPTVMRRLTGNGRISLVSPAVRCDGCHQSGQPVRKLRCSDVDPVRASTPPFPVAQPRGRSQYSPV